MIIKSHTLNSTNKSALNINKTFHISLIVYFIPLCGYINHIISSLWRTDTALSLRCSEQIPHYLFVAANGYLPHYLFVAANGYRIISSLRRTDRYHIISSLWRTVNFVCSINFKTKFKKTISIAKTNLWTLSFEWKWLLFKSCFSHKNKNIKLVTR
jgi:hypothetical protein